MQTQKTASNGSEQIQSALMLLRHEMQTPESLGVILVDYLLSEAATHGTLNTDGTIDVPMVAKIAPPGSKGPLRSDVCGSCCITAFGHEVVCVQLCHHES